MKHFCCSSNKIDLQKQAEGKRSQTLTYRMEDSTSHFTNTALGTKTVDVI